MSLLSNICLKAIATPSLLSTQLVLGFHNSFSNRLLVSMKDAQNRVVQTIFKNMGQVRAKHIEASIRQAKVELYKAQALKNIFNSQLP